MTWLEKYYHDVERGKTIAEVFRGVEDRNGVDFPIYETEEVSLIVGYEMRQELENLMEDLQSDEYRYDTTMSDDIIDFMENCIRLTKDPFYNLPMRPMLWQNAWLETLFSFKMYDEFLRRWVDRFTETLLLIGRKNTKSETSSALLDSMGFIGGKGMTLVAASNTYDQSKLVYAAADKMRMLLDPRGKDSHRNRDGITFKGVGNELVMMSERTKAKEGKNITVAVIDEEHEMLDNSLIKPIQQSMGVKHNRKMIKITTEGMVADGQLDKDLKDYRKIIAGDKSISAKRKLPWLYTQDSEAEVWETNEQGINPAWQKANPTLIYGVKQWSYLRDNVDDARRSKADRIYVLSKDFNFKVSNSTAWLEKSDYDYISEFDLEDFRGCYCLGAVDLSETTDMTNAKIMLCRKEDRRKYILSHYWIPESKLEESDDKNAGAKYQEWAQAGYITICEGNDNDLSLVADWFYSLQEKYGIRVLKCGYDQRFKRDWLNKMEYYGWVDKDDLIMINQSPDVLHTANNQVEADLKDRLIIGLNPVDKWCFGNAALKVDGRGKSLVVKIDNMKAKKIDGAVCNVILQETYNRYKTDLNDYLI
ncbi:MAG: terminase TerL endonuclease subunit [Candidatus Coproplasma sp.]